MLLLPCAHMWQHHVYELLESQGLAGGGCTCQPDLLQHVLKTFS